MLGPVDHVGYLVAEFEPGIAWMQDACGLEVVQRFERPQYSLVGAYMGEGTGQVEVFSFTDPQLLEQRLGDPQRRLDHVAHLVADIAASAERLRAAGVRFAGPDLRDELYDAVDLGGVLHLWTQPQTCGGICLQLMQRP